MTTLRSLPLLWRVCPGLLLLDVRNRLLSHPEPLCDLVLRGESFSKQPPDLTHVNPGKRRQAVVLTPVALVITHAVRSDVLSSCTPAEVSEAGVQFASSPVPSFLPFRAQADERFKHQVMQEALAARTTGSSHLYFPVAIVPNGARYEFAATPAASCLASDRPEPTEITHFVEPFPVGNRQPSFVHVDDNTTVASSIPEEV